MPAPLPGNRADKLALLREELVRLGRAADHLRWSLARCAPLAGLDDWDAEAMERLEPWPAASRGSPTC